MCGRSARLGDYLRLKITQSTMGAPITGVTALMGITELTAARRAGGTRGHGRPCKECGRHENDVAVCVEYHAGYVRNHKPYERHIRAICRDDGSEDAGGEEQEIAHAKQVDS